MMGVEAARAPRAREEPGNPERRGVMSYQIITAALTPQQVQQENDHFIVGSLIFLAICVVVVLVLILNYTSGAEEREARRARAALEAEDRRRYAQEQSWVD